MSSWDVAAIVWTGLLVLSIGGSVVVSAIAGDEDARGCLGTVLGIAFILTTLAAIARVAWIFGARG